MASKPASELSAEDINLAFSGEQLNRLTSNCWFYREQLRVPEKLLRGVRFHVALSHDASVRTSEQHSYRKSVGSNAEAELPVYGVGFLARSWLAGKCDWLAY